MDVIGIPGDYMQLMANDGALAKYDSPSFKGFAKGAIDPLLGAAAALLSIGGRGRCRRFCGASD